MPLVALMVVNTFNSRCTVSLAVESTSFRSGEIGRVNYSEIKRFIRQTSEYIHAVTLMERNVSQLFHISAIDEVKQTWLNNSGSFDYRYGFNRFANIDGMW